MDGSLVITWKGLLIAGIIVLAVYIAEMLLLMGSGKSLGLPRWRRSQDSATLEKLQAQVALLEARLARLEPTDEMEGGADMASGSYGKAFNLAKQGMDVAQVAAMCRISRSEAELIVAMQRNRLH